MSEMEQTEGRDAAGDAEALRIDAADRVLARRTVQAWSEQDQAVLEAWLAEPAHRIAYLRLDAAWERARRLEAFRPLNRIAVPQVPRPNRMFSARAAAVLGLMAALGLSGVYFSQPTMRTYATAVGERQTLTLTDGSTISLNTDTVLKLSRIAGKRMALLERGEAFFQIRHDASHPFTVSVAGHRITDLGTQFVVRDDPNALKVTLLEGRARLESLNSPSQRSTELFPGDVVVASANAMSKTRQPVRSLEKKASWQRGVLVFEDATLADAARELNRYNTQKLVIVDDTIAKLKFDASIPTNGVGTFARVAQQVFGLHVQSHENEVIISR